MRCVTAQGISLGPVGEDPDGWRRSSPSGFSGIVLATNPRSVIFELS